MARGVDATEVEQRANGFAPSFIVPGGWISPHTTDVRQLALDVATEWGLSFEGALWHLKNAQHIGARVGSVRSGSWLGATDVLVSSWMHHGAMFARREAFARLGLTLHGMYAAGV